jgi:Ca2+-binding EF-hand superfamily protein
MVSQPPIITIQPPLTPAQPPKKRGAATSSSAPAAPKRGRASKLAKENNITAEEENEIKEVFHLFSDKNADFPDEKEGVIPREDVRKALV